MEKLPKARNKMDVPKTEEKELTDEQIIKALKVVKKETLAYEYDKEKRRFEYVTGKEILDLIHRLQAESERLTEENAILKGNPPIIAGRSLGKTIREKLLMFDQMKEQNAELQKQVDELTAFKNEAISLSLYGKGRKDGEEVAVKDTAKEILNDIITGFVFGWDADNEDYANGYCQALTAYDEKIKSYIKEKYGVEVK